MTPGPIAINAATFVGVKSAGITGAIVGNARMCNALLYHCKYHCLLLYALSKFNDCPKMFCKL